MEVFALAAFFNGSDMMVSYSLLGWGPGRCVSFVVCIVVVGVLLSLIFVAGTKWLGLVAMGFSKLVCLAGFGLEGFVLEW